MGGLLLTLLSTGPGDAPWEGRQQAALLHPELCPARGLRGTHGGLPPGALEVKVHLWGREARGGGSGTLKPRAVAQGVIPQEGRGKLLCVLCSLHHLKEVLWVPGTNDPKGPPEFAVQQLKVGVLRVVREEGKNMGFTA